MTKVGNRRQDRQTPTLRNLLAVPDGPWPTQPVNPRGRLCRRSIRHGMVAAAWRPRGPRREAFPPPEWIRGSMSRAGNSRRDQRRRMIVSWSRTASSSDDGELGAVERRGADYAPAASPERQPALATILPAGLGGLAMTAVGILFVTAMVIGPNLAEIAIGRPLVAADGRFSRTLAVVENCLDLKCPGSMAAWTGQMLLVMAALVAWAVRGMRRHRRDDYNGRFRAWGWMASLLVIASLATRMPLRGLVASLIMDATGLALGPEGLGWWIAVTAVALTAVSLWAVLPLHDRTGTALWLGMSAILWAISLGCTWIAATNADSTRIAVAGQAAWILAAATTLIAMLTAARSVIREIRGEATTAAPQRSKKPVASTIITDDAAESAPESDDHTDEEDPVVFVESSESADFTDGSEESAAGRKLTKAERKRLKRMARLQQAG